MKAGLVIGSVLMLVVSSVTFDGASSTISDWWNNDWIERPGDGYTHLVVDTGHSSPDYQLFEGVKGFDWDFWHEDISLFRSGEDRPFAIIENVDNYRWLKAGEIDYWKQKLQATPKVKAPDDGAE